MLVKVLQAGGAREGVHWAGKSPSVGANHCRRTPLVLRAMVVIRTGGAEGVTANPSLIRKKW